MYCIVSRVALSLENLSLNDWTHFFACIDDNDVVNEKLVRLELSLVWSTLSPQASVMQQFLNVYVWYSTVCEQHCRIAEACILDLVYVYVAF